ncbi:MAG: pyridoxal-phosphate dependent enzyme [Flavobacteriales bacterium]|nr:MAG: pyridoxal-phosphate dependent enzyme [Flavobacteriales bacterium]
MSISRKSLEIVQSSMSQYVIKTPVLKNKEINSICDSIIFFKCENFQKSGSFKFRAATNAILNLNETVKKSGVITHSSGNFAQALALASKNQHISSYIVMPQNAPKFKKNAVLKINDNLIECKSTLDERENTTREIQNKYNLTFIHPSNNLDVILGNSTVVSELIQDHADLDYILCPIGGGGLLAGSALACNAYSNKCEIIGVEPLNVNDAYKSLKSKKIEYNLNTDTIADGLRTNLGDINFPIILEHIKSIICVSEDEIINAMKLIYNKLNILIEPSSAVAFAGVLKEKEKFKGKKVGIILSGGNVDSKKLPF